MARQHRPGPARVLYYACVYKLCTTMRPSDGTEQDWQLIHALPERTLRRCVKASYRLERRFPGYEYAVHAPAIKYIKGAHHDPEG